MRTKSSNIDLHNLKCISGGEVLTISPYLVKRNDQDLTLLLEEEQSGEEWSETDYLVLNMQASGKHKVTVMVFFDGPDEQTLLVDTSVIPGVNVVWAVPLVELQSRKWFLPASPGTFKGHVRGKPTDISRIHRIRIVVEAGVETDYFQVNRLYITNQLPRQQVTGEARIDKFGQRADLEWNGKIHNTEQLKVYLEQQLCWAQAHDTYPFADWNSYGGYQKRRFTKTGFFHTEYADERWWLVDPEGCAFFSNGLCYGNRFGTFAQTKNIENMFQWLPDREDPIFREAWANISVVPEFVKRNGIEACEDKYIFNFARANMIRVFGKEWKQAWTKISSARMKNWGFNTISVSVNNYEDEDPLAFLEQAKMPFTWALKRFPKTDRMIFRDFPDVFSPQYEEACENFARQVELLKDNPFLIGYFITNEPEWTIERSVSPALMLLQDTSKSASRDVLLSFLQETYEDIKQLNEAWECSYGAFEDIGGNHFSIDSLSKNAKEVLDRFSEIMIDRYIRLPYEAIKKVDPNHLVLGIRYATISKEYVTDADRICDVFSLNGYKREPKLLCDLVEEAIERPLMITEWHFGGNGERLYSNALINADGQVQRGLACRNYLENVISHRQCVGAVYFELNDEPALGTYDGQALQDGLVDVCNIPYEECVDKIRETSERMYPLMCQEIAPEPPEWVYFKRV